MRVCVCLSTHIIENQVAELHEIIPACWLWSMAWSPSGAWRHWDKLRTSGFVDNVMFFSQWPLAHFVFLSGDTIRAETTASNPTKFGSTPKISKYTSWSAPRGKVCHPRLLSYSRSQAQIIVFTYLLETKNWSSNQVPHETWSYECLPWVLWVGKNPVWGKREFRR